MSTKTLLLAGVLSIAAASAGYATEGPSTTAGDKNGHASAAPPCGDQCPLLAGGASGVGGDIRASLTDTGRSGQIPPLWRRVLAGGRVLGSDFHASAAPNCDTNRCPVLAGDGPPGVGDNNGRSMANNTAGERLLILAASRPNSGGNINI